MFELYSYYYEMSLMLKAQVCGLFRFIFQQILSPKSPKSKLQEKLLFFLITFHSSAHRHIPFNLYIFICEL